MGVFWWRDIKGTVVDANTGQPIEGVVVTASWILLPWGTTYPLRTLKALETVTDDLGKYTIHGWAPKFSLSGHLEDDQPKIRFFKPGYVPLVIRNNSVYHPGLEKDTDHKIKEKVTLSNGRTGIRMYEPEGHQVKFGKKLHTFRLERFEGTDGEFIELLNENYNINDRYMDILKYFIMSGRDCEWKQLPITFSTLHKLSASMESPKYKAWFNVSYLGGQDRCGSAEEYFKDYLQ